MIHGHSCKIIYLLCASRWKGPKAYIVCNTHKGFLNWSVHSSRGLFRMHFKGPCFMLYICSLILMLSLQTVEILAIRFILCHRIFDTFITVIFFCVVRWLTLWCFSKLAILCYRFLYSWLEVIKLFSCSTQLSINFIMLINDKIPTITIVGILTFIRIINKTPESLKARNVFICFFSI